MLTDEQRLQIVTLKQSGLTWKQVLNVANETFGFKTTERNCRRIMSKFRKTGSVADLPRSGRPRKLDARGERKLRRIALVNRWAPMRQVANITTEAVGQSISRHTVTRVLRKYHLLRRVAVKRPLLTLAMRRSRLLWAKAHAGWSYRRWQRVPYRQQQQHCLCDSI
jgi:transposase